MAPLKAYYELEHSVHEVLTRHLTAWAYEICNSGRSVYVARNNVGFVRQLLDDAKIEGVTVYTTMTDSLHARY